MSIQPDRAVIPETAPTTPSNPQEGHRWYMSASRMALMMGIAGLN